ncbi:DNA cytosine methyltransferase [Chloroflexota bacterium]
MSGRYPEDENYSEGSLSEEISESTWSEAVATDPKHRPQTLTRPATTVRREWSRWPQEAHLLDVQNRRYRRLTVPEIAIIQGFDPSWVDILGLSERDKIAALGNAVPPALARAIFRAIGKVWKWENRTSIEICAGIGGLAIGVSELGEFEHIALIENWGPACSILRSRGLWSADAVGDGDVRQFDFSKHRGRLGLLAGGPPCQPWSQAGHQRGVHDPRDILGYLPNMVAKCLPEVIVIENVPGLITNETNAAYLEDLIDRLGRPIVDGPTYGIAKGILIASDFGVPQVRKRLFILGFRGRSHTFASRTLQLVEKLATHRDPTSFDPQKKPWVTLGVALAGLPDPGGWRRYNGAIPEDDSVKGDGDMPEKENTDQPSKASKDLSLTVFSEVDKGQISIVSASSSEQVDRITSRISFGWPTKGEIPCFEDGKWTTKRPSALIEYAPLLLRREYDEVDSQDLSAHLAIIGDPNKALKSLQQHYKGSVRLVYFDTPRIGTDQFPVRDPGLLNSTWMSIVREWMDPCIELLAKSGVAVVHVEDQFYHYARMVLEEIFGPNNYVCTFVWEKKYGPQNDLNVPTCAQDYLITFTKGNATELPVVGLPISDNLYDDGDPRGPWRAGHKGARSGSEETKFKVKAPPYRWRVVSGELPPGLWRLNEYSGVIWGTPRETGEFRFIVEVRDANGNVATGPCIISVSEDGKNSPPDEVWWLFGETATIESGGRLTLISSTLPMAVRGQEYSVVLRASGGRLFERDKNMPGKGRYWEFSRENLVRQTLVDNVHFGADGTALPSIKKHSPTSGERIARELTWWPHQKDRVIFVGKAEDATRHLAELAERGLLKEPPRIAKPESLMKRLVLLFAPKHGDRVLSIGDLTASMTSAAIKLSRHTIHMAGNTPNDLDVWEQSAKRRIEAVLSGADNLGISVDEDVKWKGGGRLLELEAGLVFLLASSDSERLDLRLDNYKPDDERFLEAVVSLLGFRYHKGGPPHGINEFGDACVVVPPGESLTEIRLSEYITRFSQTVRKLTIVFEKSLLLEGVRTSDDIRLIRIPFDLIA